jgi:predicted CopG family antitoxin
MSLSIALGNCGFLNWGWFIVGRRVISVSEDVYRRLSRLAVERNKTINDLIEELLDNYEGRVGVSSIVEELGEVKAMLRDCLDRLGVRQSVENKPVEAESKQTEARLEPKGEVGGDSVFGDNPWVQVLRVKYSQGS